MDPIQAVYLGTAIPAVTAMIGGIFSVEDNEGRKAHGLPTRKQARQQRRQDKRAAHVAEFGEGANPASREHSTTGFQGQPTNARAVPSQYDQQ